jgi:hypothetical protein
MDISLDSHQSPSAPEIRRYQTAFEIIFDGTKLPLVVEEPNDHHLQYRIALVEYPPVRFDRPDENWAQGIYIIC